MTSAVILWCTAKFLCSCIQGTTRLRNGPLRPLIIATTSYNYTIWVYKGNTTSDGKQTNGVWGWLCKSVCPDDAAAMHAQSLVHMSMIDTLVVLAATESTKLFTILWYQKKLFGYWYKVISFVWRICTWRNEVLIYIPRPCAGRKWRVC